MTTTLSLVKGHHDLVAVTTPELQSMKTEHRVSTDWNFLLDLSEENWLELVWKLLHQLNISLIPFILK